MSAFLCELFPFDRRCHSLACSYCGARATLFARLNHETAVALPHASISTTPKAPQVSAAAADFDIAQINAASLGCECVFVTSDLKRAARLAEHALRRYPNNAEALFVRMEVATIESSMPSMLDAVISLCEAGEQSP